MARHRILLYSLDGSTERVSQVLSRHDPEGLIELVGVAHRPMVPPAPARPEGRRPTLCIEP